MNEMETDVAGLIVNWALFRFKGIEDLSHEDMVDAYWKEYFCGCTMSTPETGLEIIQ